MRLPATRLLFLLLLPPVLAQAAPPARPTKLGLCLSCHGVNGRATAAGIPHLAGQDLTYLVSSLQAYRRGSRQAPPMNSIANTLQPRDIEALAGWYAAQAGGLR